MWTDVGTNSQISRSLYSETHNLKKKFYIWDKAYFIQQNK